MKCQLAALILLSTALTLSAYEPNEADVKGFKQEVAPLFAKYCLDCHSPDDPDGNVATG